LVEDVDPEIPARRFFADGPIEVMVTQVRGRQVKLGISADRRFLILRDELTPYARHSKQKKSLTPSPLPEGEGIDLPSPSGRRAGDEG
jgi:sRNA-binding carbon storage regulator CsrA